MNDFRFSFKPENLIQHMPEPGDASSGMFVRMTAGRGITREAIGKVALLDFEHNRADLREHLPRPFGLVTEVFSSFDGPQCVVRIGEDPHATLREEQKAHKEDLRLREIELDELQKDYEDECRACDAVSKDFNDAGLKIDELEAELAKTKLELVAAEAAGRFFARSAVGLSSQIYAMKNALSREEAISQTRLKACLRYEYEAMPKLRAEIEKLKAPKPEPKPQKWGVYFAARTAQPGKLTDCFKNTYDTGSEAEIAVAARIKSGMCAPDTYEIRPIV